MASHHLESSGIILTKHIWTRALHLERAANADENGFANIVRFIIQIQ